MTTAWIDPPVDDAVVVPDCGGLLHGINNNVIVWNGYDPDANILDYSFVVDLPASVSTEFLAAYPACPKHKGPLHLGQFLEIGIKEEAKTQKRCTTKVWC